MAVILSCNSQVEPRVLQAARAGRGDPPALPVATRHRRPRFIFGHSTGHSGSTTLHKVLASPGCPWQSVARFEMRSKAGKGEKGWAPDYPACANMTRHLVPEIAALVRGETEGGEIATFLDLGHYHNRGRVVECLAAVLGDSVAFVRIRCDRYAIARSYASKFGTPCLAGKLQGSRRPGVTLCPRSDEGDGPVDLPVPDDATWDGLTPFQRFLWYADEVEHRWVALRAARRPGPHGGPRFLELTWSRAEEMAAGARRLRRELGCADAVAVRDEKRHVAHEKGRRACAADVRQDLEYRRRMGYNASTLRILVSERLPQHVDSEECVELPQEMEHATRAHAAKLGMPYVADEWVFGGKEAT